jgi:outer membrane protein OmpA-like peptidoglycan-associated protein
MRFPILATVMSIVLGGGMALADTGGAQTGANAGVSTPVGGAHAGANLGVSGQTGNTQTSADLGVSGQSQKIAPPMPTENDVFFDTDSSLLTYANDSDLQRLADWSKCKKANVIKLEGHADPRGTVEHNAQLSADRAIAVRDKLIDLGVPRDRIVVTIYGELGKRRETLAEDRRVSAMPTKMPVVVGSR